LAEVKHRRGGVVQLELVDGGVLDDVAEDGQGADDVDGRLNVEREPGVSSGD
jgi:hypothetical protein